MYHADCLLFFFIEFVVFSVIATLTLGFSSFMKEVHGEVTQHKLISLWFGSSEIW